MSDLTATRKLLEFSIKLAITLFRDSTIEKNYKLSKEQEDALYNYSKNIGLAFQVSDDILDETGNKEEMGKAVNKDSSMEKNTFPRLLGLGESIKYGADLVNTAIESIRDLKGDTEPLSLIAKFIIERKK